MKESTRGRAAARSPELTDPDTKAGRALLRDLVMAHPSGQRRPRQAILAIEAEARATAVQRIKWFVDAEDALDADDGSDPDRFTKLSVARESAVTLLRALLADTEADARIHKHRGIEGVDFPYHHGIAYSTGSDYPHGGIDTEAESDDDWDAPHPSRLGEPYDCQHNPQHMEHMEDEDGTEMRYDCDPRCQPDTEAERHG